MGIKSTTFYDPAARRRKLVYLLSFLVVVGCMAAILILSGKDGKQHPEAGPDVAGTPADAPAPANPGAGTDPAPESGGATSEPPSGIGAPDPAREGLRKAEELFTSAMGLVRDAMSATAGTRDAETKRGEALKALLAAQAAYDAWLLDHPDDESALDRRLTELSSQIYWARKSMAVTEFGPSSGDTGDGGEDDPAPPTRPEPPHAIPPRATPPRDTPAAPVSELDPEREAARFVSDARRAFRAGRPEDVVDAGKALLADPRMAEKHEELRPYVTAAEGMAAFLTSVRTGLAVRVNEIVTLALRGDPVTGVLTATDPEIVLQTEEGERTIPTRELSAAELVARAEAAGGLAGADARAFAGAYLLSRGDLEEGARQLVYARAAGADVSRYDAELARALARWEELRALEAWLPLAPKLAAPDAALLGPLRAFRSGFGSSGVFREHREELFRAEAAAASDLKFEVEDVFRIPVKISGRGQVQLAYDFEKPEELEDFGTSGKWEIVDGELVGGRGRAWLARFDLENVDLTFTLPEGGPATIGLWGRADAERRGVNLSVAPGPDGLTIALYHGDRKIALETVKAPNHDLELVLQKRDDKYQVRLNRKVVIKATDVTGRAKEKQVAIGIYVRDGTVAIGDLEIAGTLDMDWAKAGGERFSNWLKNWFVTGPFAIDRKELATELSIPHWPEERPFDPGDVGEGDDTKPAWTAREVSTGWLDLNRCFKPNDGVAAYCAARVWSPERRSALLEIAVDDAARVWMNGEPVAKEIPLGDAVRVPVHLEAGDNVLLAKVLDVDRSWWIRARLLTKSGEPMLDVIGW